MAATHPSEEVIRWVTAQLNDVVDEDGIVNLIELYHSVEDGPAELMHSAKVSDNSDPMDIAQDLWEAAITDADTRMSGRMQRYVMLSFRADNPDHTHSARHPFMMNGRATSDIFGGNTEGANPVGHMGQLMRHTEKLHTSIMQLTEMTAGRLARDLQDERKKNMVLELERTSQFEAMRDLEDRKHEREIETAREEARAKRNDQMLALLLSMAPLVMSKMLGAPVGGPQLPAAGARDEAVHQLMKGLSPEEIEKVFGALQPNNQLVLMELYQAHKEVEEERTAPASKKLEAPKSPATPKAPRKRRTERSASK